MSSLDQRRSRPCSTTALASILLLLTSGAVTVAAAQTKADQTEADQRRQKIQDLRDANASAQRDAHELRVQMDQLQAEAIDRGLLLTLDDSVFVTNKATLSSNGHLRLNGLAAFLKQHPKHSVAIDGYAGAGDYRYDQALSKRRADAVKAYLIRQDIAPSRLTARSSDEALQNQEAQEDAIAQRALRRVEVIIEDPLTAVPSSM